MSSPSMDDLPEHVSSFFTKWSSATVEHVSTNDIQISAGNITIQHMASYYGYRDIKGNLGKNTEHRANINAAQLAAWVDVVPEHCENIIKRAILTLENCKNYKEVHGMFPGERDGELGQKLKYLKQIASGIKSSSMQPQIQTLLKEYGVGKEKKGKPKIH